MYPLYFGSHSQLKCHPVFFQVPILCKFDFLLKGGLKPGHGKSYKDCTFLSKLVFFTLIEQKNRTFQKWPQNCCI